MESKTPSTAIPSRLLCAAGALLLVLAGLADPALVGRYHFRTPLSDEARAETLVSRAVFGLAGAALLAAGLLARRAASSRQPSRGSTRAVLVLLCGLLPLFVLERAARPFVERLTTLFQEDPELGWRLRPSVEDTYWGTRARVNPQGMRGPEHRPRRTAGTRLLVLGDSVVFGLGIAEDADTFPSRLERALGAQGGGPFECLNAGVPGWSTRQERQFLERECERWTPDLVVLAFVLNDVSEGTRGHLAVQLAYTRPAGMPAWLAESGIHLALRELAFRRALAGDSPAALAHRARLTPYHVLLEPDSDAVRAAWTGILAELEGLLAWSRARALPLVLVVFPLALQLREPEADAPQQTLGRFASERGLAFLDLLPAFVAAGRARNVAPADLFLDGVHPTPTGNELAAVELARFLMEAGMLP